jgi:hypothetical protein
LKEKELNNKNTPFNRTNHHQNQIHLPPWIGFYCIRHVALPTLSDDPYALRLVFSSFLKTWLVGRAAASFGLSLRATIPAGFRLVRGGCVFSPLNHASAVAAPGFEWARVSGNNKSSLNENECKRWQKTCHVRHERKKFSQTHSKSQRWTGLDLEEIFQLVRLRDKRQKQALPQSESSAGHT